MTTSHKKPFGSQSVMAQRIEPSDSLDDFPTPPWAVRAFCDHFIPFWGGSVLDPAANRGYMVHALQDYFHDVEGFDVHDYGVFPVRNFLERPRTEKKYDWIITNPPFRLAEDFIEMSILNKPNRGFAMLCRTNFTESVGRYNKIYSKLPPSHIAFYSERVPMVKGKYEPTASTATAYAWFVWRRHPVTNKFVSMGTSASWIPPNGKKTFVRASDLKMVEFWKEK